MGFSRQVPIKEYRTDARALSHPRPNRRTASFPAQGNAMQGVLRDVIVCLWPTAAEGGVQRVPVLQQVRDSSPRLFIFSVNLSPVFFVPLPLSP